MNERHDSRQSEHSQQPRVLSVTSPNGKLMERPYPAFPAPLFICLMRQFLCKIGGKSVPVPTIRYRSRRISVRPRPPSNRTNPPRATQYVSPPPSFPLLPPSLPSSPVQTRPKSRRINTMAQKQIGEPVRNMFKDAGRPPTLSHVSHRHHRFWVGTSFCDVPRPPPRPRPSQLSHHPSPSYEPPAPWTKPDAVTTRDLGRPIGGHCTSYGAGPLHLSSISSPPILPISLSLSLAVVCQPNITFCLGKKYGHGVTLSTSCPRLGPFFFPPSYFRDS
ncbi:hypothetical protein LZ31DRAFT_168745 [Colletotrichum somersetense]|nr:hypothetical protein LZ31DRAFT_168745 [Colletotrichum somersetense]